jgi:hypothetical protein
MRWGLAVVLVLCSAGSAALLLTSGPRQVDGASGLVTASDAAEPGNFGTPRTHRPIGVPTPVLIKHGWDIPSPGFVREHITAMERMPFDGITVSLPELGSRVQRREALTYAEFQEELAPLGSVHSTRLAHNYAVVFATPAGSFFDDYSIPVANFAMLARAAKSVGLEGILYDNEEYFGSVAAYPANCPGHTIEQCQDQARLRGQQVMDAMRAEWPGIRVMTFFGPWVSDPQTARFLSPILPYHDVSGDHQLMGSFVVGLTASTVGTRAQVVDAGEIYGAATPAQFAAVNFWRKHGMPGRSSLIPTPLKSSWAQIISTGFVIYDQSDAVARGKLDGWQRLVSNALAATDEYVVVYTERFDWWGTGWPTDPVPQAWIRATADARARAAGS